MCEKIEKVVKEAGRIITDYEENVQTRVIEAGTLVGITETLLTLGTTGTAIQETHEAAREYLGCVETKRAAAKCRKESTEVLHATQAFSCQEGPIKPQWLIDQEKLALIEFEGQE